MARRMATPPQLELFRTASPEAAPVVGPAAVPPEVTALGQQLPAQLYLGTSSWAFSGWQGLVYDRESSAKDLAHHGLAAYAQHPLLRAVGLDRTFYAPIAAEEYAAYAAAVPEPFRFIVKAHAWCTQPLRRTPGHDEQPNAWFLHPDYAVEQVVTPCHTGLGAKLGALVFQFSPMDVPALGGPQAFATRLHAFLAALPPGPRYAVEIRNASLLCPAYLQALTALGVCHCYNIHPRMPALSVQQERVPVETMPALLIRWSLHPTQRYEAARSRYAPFDRLVDEDLDSRQAVATLCLQAIAMGRPAFVTANNKAEGSAPGTVQRLAAQVVSGL